MGGALANPKLEWGTKRDLREMDEPSKQRISICIPGGFNNVDPIDAMIEDITDGDRFNGYTSADDFFDVA